MNIDKFTQNSIRAVNNCQKIALDYGNQELVPAHLVYSLLTIDESLIKKLVEKMWIDPDDFSRSVLEIIEKRPKVQGGEPFMGQELNKILTSSSDEAKVMGDSYVSVEHLFLSAIKYPGRELKEVFKDYGITRDHFLQVLSEVRGNQTVNTDNPEDTYDVLEKYGTNLVARAREQKLDPVIGRDSEIRNMILILSRKTKNNPVLIGEPGVGKTAIVEGLAWRIMDRGAWQITKTKYSSGMIKKETLPFASA